MCDGPPTIGGSQMAAAGARHGCMAAPVTETPARRRRPVHSARASARRQRARPVPRRTTKQISLTHGRACQPAELVFSSAFSRTTPPFSGPKARASSLALALFASAMMLAAGGRRRWARPLGTARGIVKARVKASGFTARGDLLLAASCSIATSTRACQAATLRSGKRLMGVSLMSSAAFRSACQTRS